jgi:hypothetical protein
MREALQLVQSLMDQQGAPATPTDEDLESLTWSLTIRDMEKFLRAAEPLLAGHGADSVARFELPGGQLELVSISGSAEWRSNATPLATVLDGLTEDQPRWPTERLLAVAGEFGSEGVATITLPKEPWRRALAQTLGRTIWIGPTGAGFETWLVNRPWTASAEALFTSGGAAVLTDDWRGQSRPCGPYLVFGHPDDADVTKPGEAPGFGDVEDRPALSRAIWLEPTAPVPPGTRVLLQGIAASAAAWVLAEDREGSQVRPLYANALTFELGQAPPRLSDLHGVAIVALARWVATEFNETRLDVARNVTVERIADPFDATPAPGILGAASLAYRVVIQKEVQTALDRQQKFEETFADLDKEVARMRSELSATVDQVVTRVLAGVLGIAIAALASTKIRGWPATVGALLIVGYIVSSILVIQFSTKAESRDRLDDAEDQIAGRRAALSPELAEVVSARIQRWRGEIDRRILIATILLAAIAVAVLIAGIAGYVAAESGGSGGGLDIRCTGTRATELHCTGTLPVR